MKAINRGDNTYDIFDDTMQVFEKLPAQPYIVRFQKSEASFWRNIMIWKSRSQKFMVYIQKK